MQRFILTNSVAQEPEGSSPHSQKLATGPYLEFGSLRSFYEINGKLLLLLSFIRAAKKVFFI
jgi:hypothetical protein